MNCKPGDLAVFVHSAAGNEGKIVRVLKPSGLTGLKRRDGSILRGFIWEIDPPVPAWNGSLVGYAGDANLRPIRDPGDDVPDESTAWLPPVPFPEIA